MKIDIFSAIFGNKQSPEKNKNEKVSSLENARRERDLEKLSDYFKNGVPITEEYLCTRSIVYLYFNGTISLTPSDLKKYEIPANDPRIPRTVKTECNKLLGAPTIPDEKLSYEEIIIWKAYEKFGDLLPKKIELAYKWTIDHSEELIECSQSGSDGLHFFAWLHGEESTKELFQQRRKEEWNRPHSEFQSIVTAISKREPYYIASTDLGEIGKVLDRAITAKSSEATTGAILAYGEKWTKIATTRSKLTEDEAREFFYTGRASSGIWKYLKVLMHQKKHDAAITTCREAIKLGINDCNRKKLISDYLDQALKATKK